PGRFPAPRRGRHACPGKTCRAIRCDPSSQLSGNRLNGVIHARVHVRPGSQNDLVAVNDLYNHYVAESHYTFDDELVSIEARRQWFTHYAGTGPYRVFVAIDEERLVGFASSSRFRP